MRSVYSLAGLSGVLAFALSACTLASGVAEEVFPSPVAYVPAEAPPQPTATPTLAPLPTPTVLPTSVPRPLPQDTTAAIGLWSDQLVDAAGWPGFLDVAQGEAALEYRAARNNALIALGGGQVYSAPPEQLAELQRTRPNWLLYDSKGRVALASADQRSPLLDIRNAEVREYLAQRVVEVLSEKPWDGIVLSGVGEDLIRPTASPIFTGTRPFTPDQRRDAVEGLLRAVRARVPDKLIIIGGYAWKDGQAYTANANAARLLATLADGVHVEHFLRHPVSKTNEFKSEAAWKQDVDYLSLISQNDQIVLITTRLSASNVSPEIVQQWMRYAVASYLLGKNGARTYFQLDAGDPVYLADPYFNAPVGAPIEPYVKLSNGLYARRFQNGLVLVNPSAEKKTAKLDGSYRTLSGASVEESVTMGPQTGLILLRR